MINISSKCLEPVVHLFSSMAFYSMNSWWRLMVNRKYLTSAYSFYLAYWYSSWVTILLEVSNRHCFFLPFSALLLKLSGKVAFYGPRLDQSLLEKVMLSWNLLLSWWNYGIIFWEKNNTCLIAESLQYLRCSNENISIRADVLKHQVATLSGYCGCAWFLHVVMLFSG